VTETAKITYRQYGGKASIAKWIVSHLPAHRIYAEPFCGSAAVLLAKPRSFIEIINDLDGRIINMFRQIRERPRELAALLWATPFSQENWRDVPPPDDVDDARLLMAQGAQFYCGNGNSSTWAIDKCSKQHKPRNEVWADWFLRILPAANRLRSVQILHEDALTTIERVYKQDTQTVLYIDPPYRGHEKEYRFQVNYEEMVRLLHEATCRVVVSEYRTAEPFFKDWRAIEKETVSRAGVGRHGYSGKRKTEILYTNF